LAVCAVAHPAATINMSHSNSDLLFINFKNKLFKKRGSIFGPEKSRSDYLFQ
jgi:hypothetical protein